MTTDGYPVEPQISIPPNATSISISKDGVVSVALPGQAASQQVGTLELAIVPEPRGPARIGGNLFCDDGVGRPAGRGRRAPTAAA